MTNIVKRSEGTKEGASSNKKSRSRSLPIYPILGNSSAQGSSSTENVTGQSSLREEICGPGQ